MGSEWKKSFASKKRVKPQEPPPGIAQWCAVCGKRFYAEQLRILCSMDCYRKQSP